MYSKSKTFLEKIIKITSKTNFLAVVPMSKENSTYSFRLEM